MSHSTSIDATRQQPVGGTDRPLAVDSFENYDPAVEHPAIELCSWSSFALEKVHEACLEGLSSMSTDPLAENEAACWPAALMAYVFSSLPASPSRDSVAGVGAENTFVLP